MSQAASNYTVTRSATGGVTLSGEMSDKAIHSFCSAVGWVEDNHTSGAAQSQAPRFVFRGLRANECLDGATRPWQLAPEPPRREGLRAKGSTPVGLTRALEEGSALSNEFIHCTVSPVAAVFYASAFHTMGTCARVVKIDLEAISSESVIDVSSMDGCRGRGIPSRSIAEKFAVAHEVVLLSDPVPPTAIVAVYDVSWVRDLPRGERQTCSLHAYTEKIPKLLLSEIKAWTGPIRVKDLPDWHSLFALPLKHLWRAENSRQLHMYGPPAVAPLLETAQFAYFPAGFAEGVMDALDERQRHWLLQHGFQRETQVWDDHENRWVQLHPHARVHIDGEKPIPPALLMDPSFGALHVEMAVEIQASLLINRRWHDGESRESHVSRKCDGEGGDEWARQFLKGCKILEEEYSEDELLRKIRLASISAVRSLGFVCHVDSDSSVPAAAVPSMVSSSAPASIISSTPSNTPHDSGFEAGSRVQLNGLQNAAHLNGRNAHVLHFVESAGRYAVQLELARRGEKPSFKAKPANLQALAPLPRTAAELQKLVDATEDGGVVSMPAGRFVGAKLEIKRAMTIQGQGPTATVITFPLLVGNGASGALLHLSNFGVDGASLTVGATAIQRAHLFKVNVSLQSTNDDALVLNQIGQGYARDRVLVEDCEVRGGGDGVMINASGVRLLRCRIIGAYSRGIFANPDFVIEDSTVNGCGGYGMKIRGGCERRGRNNIQPGPWDGHMEFGLNDDEEDEIGPHGFTHEEEMELLSQGVKPWDDDAHAVLAALNGEY